MAVPNTFATATSAIPLANLDANFAYYDGAFSISGAATTFSGAVTLTSNLTFTGAGNRITGDFSNATVANRVTFQTSTSNSNTSIGVIPNGTATGTNFSAFAGTDSSNASFMRIRTDGTLSYLESDRNGTGTYLPMTFYTGGSERMRLDTSGNVGIGTTSPGVKLDVAGAIRSTNSNVYAGDGSAFAWGAASTYVGGSSSTNIMTFVTSSSERMRIVSSGNVGIGTATPSALLHVLTANPTAANEVARFQGGTNASNFRNYISLYTTNQNYWWELSNQDSAGTGSTNGFAFIENSGGVATNRVYFASGGNVGIGTSSPSAKLDVTGGIKVSGQLMAGTSGSVYSPLVSAAYVSGTSNLYLRNLSGTNRIDSYNDPITATYPLQLNASQITFYIADAEKMRIDSSGNVGIGGTPAYKLDITSSAFIGSRLTAATGTNGVSQIYTNTGGTFSIGIDASTGANFGAAYGGFLWHAGAYPLLFGTSNTERMRIDSSGNVGIGTSSPSSYGKFAVIGNGTTSSTFSVVATDSAGTSNFTVRDDGLVTANKPAGLGYGTGSGGTVTQATSRTTGVTLSKPTGAITMFSAAGSVVAATFTVTNTLVAATDTIILNQKSGTNLYVLLVTAVAAGSFNITFYTTGGVATDAPVINFAIIKGATA